MKKRLLLPLLGIVLSAGAQERHRPTPPQPPSPAAEALYYREAVWAPATARWTEDSLKIENLRLTPSALIRGAKTRYPNADTVEHWRVYTDAQTRDTAHYNFHLDNAGQLRPSLVDQRTYDAAGHLVFNRSLFYDVNTGDMLSGTEYMATYNGSGILARTQVRFYTGGAWADGYPATYGYSRSAGAPDTVVYYTTGGVPVSRGLHWPVSPGNYEDTLAITENYDATSGTWQASFRVRKQISPTRTDEVQEIYSGSAYVPTQAYITLINDTSNRQYVLAYDATLSAWDTSGSSLTSFEPDGRRRVYEYRQKIAGAGWQRLIYTFEAHTYRQGDLARTIFYSYDEASQTWLPTLRDDYVYPLQHTRAGMNLSLTAYPNPARDEVTVLLPSGLDPTTGLLFDATGKAVVQAQALPGSVRFKTTGLPAGSYTARFTGTAGTAQVRVVVR